MFCFQISLKRQEKIEGPTKVACKQFCIYSVAKKCFRQKVKFLLKIIFFFKKKHNRSLYQSLEEKDEEESHLLFFWPWANFRLSALDVSKDNGLVGYITSSDLVVA